MPRRSGWPGLSVGYKAYLRRRGVTRRDWERGQGPLRVRSASAWNRLSAQYRSRLQSQGIGESEWRGGYSAKRAPPPPTAPQVSAITSRLNAGTDTPADARALERWYRTKSVYPHLRDQPGASKAATAAVLSQIISPPETWRNVVLIPAPQGRPWVMSVQYKDGSHREIEVPSWLAQDVMAWLTQEEEDIGLEWDVGGTL